MTKLLVGAEIHVARVWDKLEKKVSPGFLNPNKAFSQFLKKAGSNPVMLNGDLVDYYFSDRQNKQDNWGLFLRLLKQHRGMNYLNLGNHDYRMRPYCLKRHGLWHVNLGEGHEKAIEEIEGTHYHLLEELKAVSVNLKKFDPLQKYTSPEFYSKTEGKYELIVLNTGPDAFASPLNWSRPWRWRKLLRFESPPSQGLTREQINFLQERLRNSEKDDIMVFVHCPPFFTLGRLDHLVRSRKDYAEMLKISLKRATSPVGFGCFLDYNWEFISALAASDRNIAVISSHTHVPGQFAMDRKTRRIRNVSIERINSVKDDARYVKFLTTLPLGAIRPENKRTGYLEIDKKGFRHVVMKDYS